MTLPAILTRHLGLVPFDDRFITARYAAWLNDKDTTRYMRHSNMVHTLDTCRAYVNQTAVAGHMMFAILADLDHIGNMTIVPDRLNSRADVSILLGERRGRGYGAEAWRGMCDWLLRDTLAGGFRKVTAGCIVSNTPMIRCFEATGMVPDGCRVRHDLREGEMVDVVHFARFRDG